MNKKQKIIVSVVGIFIVLLILVGLTYAYFLTRIKGNTNEKSITVSTTNLEVEYIDGTNEIATASSIRPSNNVVLTKEFSVKNNGEETNYVVVIENIEIKDKNNNTTTFNSNDFTYVLECTNSNDSSSCNDMGEQKLPLSKGTLSFNTIKEGVIQNFVLKVYYKETGIDQSNDMGKTLSAKINISNGSDLTKLSDVIKLNNTPIQTTKPNFSAYYSSDEGLIQDVDADGKTYYFRGTVEDNYVRFANLTYPEDLYGFNIADEDSAAQCVADGYDSDHYDGWCAEKHYSEGDEMLWRIVRINGDGTIRLVTNGSVGKSAYNTLTNNEKYVGYTYDNSLPNVQDGTKSTIKQYVDDWYTSKMTLYDSYIVSTRFCNDTSVSSISGSEIYYGTSSRLSEYQSPADKDPTFICESTEKTYGGEYILKVGLLTADEVLFSGGFGYGGSDFYLNEINDFWSASPEKKYHMLIVTDAGIGGYSLNYDGNVRPVINLKADTLFISGNGTKNNPYVIR